MLFSVLSSGDMPPALVTKDMYCQSILLNQGHNICYILHNQMYYCSYDKKIYPIITLNSF